MSLFLLFLRPWTNPLNTLGMGGKGGGGRGTKNKTGPHFWKKQCSLTSPRLTFLPPHNYQPSGSPWLHLPLWVRAHNSVSNGVDMRRLTLGRGRWRGGQDITPSAFKEAVRTLRARRCFTPLPPLLFSFTRSLTGHSFLLSTPVKCKVKHLNWARRNRVGGWEESFPSPYSTCPASYSYIYIS